MPGSSLKVVIIHNIIAPYKTLLFNELCKVRNNLKVLYMAETESNRDWLISKDELKFPYEFVSEGQLQNHNRFKTALKIWRRLNDLKPDVVILGGYIYPACWAGFLWAKLNGKKIILWSASNEADKSRTVLKEKLKGLLVKRCHAANVYGQKSSDYLVKLGLKEDAIFIKGNTTDNDFYYSRTSRLRGHRDLVCKQLGCAARNFLYIGRFSEEKNVLHLLKAYKRLRPPDDWGLVLVGDGTQREEIAGYIRQHALRNILMPGFQQKEEIPKFLAVGDIFVLPSVSETWGLAVNEAMAAGLPALVSKGCGCCTELIKEGVNGFSFDPCDKDELFELMQNVVDGRYDLMTMGEASLDIIKDYTPVRAAKIVCQAIEFALSSTK